MSIKWTEAEVISAFQEALNPIQTGDKRALLLEQLATKTQQPIRKSTVTPKGRR